MISFLTKNKGQRSQAPIRPIDRILEFVVLCMAVALLMCTIAFYLSSPDRVASHIGFHGEADAWGPRSTFWTIGIMGLLVTGLMVWAAYKPSLINIPVKLRPEVLPRQHQLMGEMVRVLAINISATFILSEWMLASVTPEQPKVTTPLFVCFLLSISLMILLAGLYTWRIHRV
jgi:uncharacterized membrane protein